MSDRMMITGVLIRRMKRFLVNSLPGIKSSHLSEAIAAGYGFKTHAALLFSLLAGHEILVFPKAMEFADRLVTLCERNGDGEAEKLRLIFADAFRDAMRQ